MSNIPMPPTEPFDHKRLKRFFISCQEFEDDPIYIPINKAGEFLCFPAGEFTPPLPFGPQEVGTLGPFKPVHNNKDVFMIYVEKGTSDYFITNIQVRSKCGDRSE